MSGRHAVCVSRRVEGARGFYTLVYDDVEGSPLLAYFTPTGKACCYYPSGAIRMLCNRDGGSMFSEVNQLFTVTSIILKTRALKAHTPRALHLASARLHTDLCNRAYNCPEHKA